MRWRRREASTVRARSAATVSSRHLTALPRAPEAPARLDVPHDLVRRERSEERLPVRLRREARVEHGEDAAVGAAAEQAAEALLQLEHGEGDLVLGERVAALVADPVDARGDERV